MADPRIHILSLCSGTAMLDEGLCAALPAARVVGYVEREAYAASLLLARMGDQALVPAPVWCGNLEDFPAIEWRGTVDGITAGFPCQPWSQSGKQQGTDDERWIWPAIVGLAREVGPDFLFLENVPGLVSAGGLALVLGDLAALGFDAEWISLRASDVGAAHQRERIFILAVHAERGCRVLRESSAGSERLAYGRDGAVDDSVRVSGEQRTGRERILDSGAEMANPSGGQFPIEGIGPGGRNGPRPAGEILADADGRQREQSGRTEPQPGGRLCGPDGGGAPVADGERNSVRSEGSAGDGETPIGSEGKEQERQRIRFDAGSDGSTMADGGRERSQGSGATGPEARTTGRSGAVPIFAPGPADPEWGAILRERPWLAPAVLAGEKAPESGVRGMADGDALVVDESRADQLRAIGNGVVALQAAVAFTILARRFGDS